MPVMRPTLSRETYVRLLEQLQSVVGPLEARLLTLPVPAAFELEARRKAPLLSRDLALLTTPRPRLDAGALPLSTGLPEALGALYVLEGATLGGQVIVRSLRRSLGITPESGGAYFHAYGPETGRMWQSFGDAMRREVAPEDEERVIAGARDTFLAFANALRSVPA